MAVLTGEPLDKLTIRRLAITRATHRLPPLDVPEPEPQARKQPANIGDRLDWAVEAACAAFGTCTPEEVRSFDSSHHITSVRGAVFALLSEAKCHRQEDIGAALNRGKDTVSSAVMRHRVRLTESAAYRAKYEATQIRFREASRGQV